MVLVRPGVVAVLGPAGVVPRLFLGARSPMGPPSEKCHYCDSQKGDNYCVNCEKACHRHEGSPLFAPLPEITRDKAVSARRRPLEDKESEVDVIIDLKTASLSFRWFRTEAACNAAAQSNHDASASPDPR